MNENVSLKVSKWGDLAVRCASAIILIPAVLLFNWLGGVWFGLFILLVGCMMAYEWARIVHPGNAPQYVAHMAAALLGAFVPELFGVWAAGSAILALAVVSGLMMRFGNIPSSKWSYFGVCYVGFACIAFVTLRNDPQYGMLALLWIFLIVWAADTLAYFAGRIIGGPKLAPAVSPKKTWAGLGGAIVGSALASGLFAHFANLNGLAELALLAGLLAIVEQAGDLFESALKRFYGVKDSSRLIPGHGGVIDRVDGLVAVAIAAALIGFFRLHGASPAQGLLLW